jgi:hypothetical protein
MQVLEHGGMPVVVDDYGVPGPGRPLLGAPRLAPGRSHAELDD